MANISWKNIQSFGSKSYRCSHCGKELASEKGYEADRSEDRTYQEHICICHFCHKPTYIDKDNKQYPGVAFGNAVDGIDDESLQSLYEEARKCASVNSFTAASMACRKILMNLAVAKGAKENLKFVQYVKFLSDNNFVPPDGKEWVAHIKDKGNDANHKIEIVSKEDGEELLYFTEMLLTFIYAVPARFKKSTKSKDKVSESKTQSQ
jgi:DNA-directed RNA polymerase subunit RPC12/RpoP